MSAIPHLYRAAQVACCAAIPFSIATSTGGIALLMAALVGSVGLGACLRVCFSEKLAAVRAPAHTSSDLLATTFFSGTVLAAILHISSKTLLPDAHALPTLMRPLHWLGSAETWLPARLGILCSAQVVVLMSRATLLGSLLHAGMIGWQLTQDWLTPKNDQGAVERPHVATMVHEELNARALEKCPTAFTSPAHEVAEQTHQLFQASPTATSLGPDDLVEQETAPEGTTSATAVGLPFAEPSAAAVPSSGHDPAREEDQEQGSPQGLADPAHRLDSSPLVHAAVPPTDFLEPSEPLGRSVQAAASSPEGAPPVEQPRALATRPQSSTTVCHLEYLCGQTHTALQTWNMLRKQWERIINKIDDLATRAQRDDTLNHAELTTLCERLERKVLAVQNHYQIFRKRLNDLEKDREKVMRGREAQGCAVSQKTAKELQALLRQYQQNCQSAALDQAVTEKFRHVAQEQMRRSPVHVGKTGHRKISAPGGNFVVSVNVADGYQQKAVYSRNGKWLMTMPDSRGLESGAFAVSDDESRIAVIRPLTHQEGRCQLELRTVEKLGMSCTPAKVLEVPPLPQGHVLLSTFLLFTDNGEGVFAVLQSRALLEPESPGRSYLAQWRWDQEAGSPPVFDVCLPLMNCCSVSTAHVVDHKIRLFGFGQFQNERVTHIHEGSLTREGVQVMRSIPLPPTPSSDSPSYLSHEDRCFVASNKYACCFRGLDQEQCLDHLCVFSLPLEGDPKPLHTIQVEWQGGSQIVMSPTDEIAICTQSAAGQTQQVSLLVNLATGQTAPGFDLNWGSAEWRKTRDLQFSSDGLQLIGICSKEKGHKTFTEVRTMPLPADLVAQVCPEFFLRREAGQVQTALDVLREETAQKKLLGEPLSMLMLRAVVYEHTLLLLRRALQRAT